MMIGMKLNPLSVANEVVVSTVAATKGAGEIPLVPCSRFGRKKVLVASQLGLMTLGVAVGFSPSYSVLAFLKFVIGGLEQVGRIQ